ncbi:hypothetical protein GCM10009721_43530 [Terrabacter tumescens]|uniref:Uncharacterized protein n=1 Tax=Terrabacter tumescens TaxID=60443 RepID=A0ABQ2ILW8_9MICO|nr:hypothetical protein GCM10009721_43530 [Terrabacter tumescens]
MRDMTLLGLGSWVSWVQHATPTRYAAGPVVRDDRACDVGLGQLLLPRPMSQPMTTPIAAAAA